MNAKETIKEIIDHLGMPLALLILIISWTAIAMEKAGWLDFTMFVISVVGVYVFWNWRR